MTVAFGDKPAMSALSASPETAQIVLVPALTPPSTGNRSTLSLDSTSGGPARTVKPKQRNNAERRASHNAVERQRREALNARFLDLAAMLPNLANIRRPSKSSIVNSSIAHVRASRRHRFIASQQVRALKEECDSLRREVNEWRKRAGVDILLNQPDRGEAFALILAGAEFEYEDGDLQSGDGEEEEEGEEYGGGVPSTREDMARLELIQHYQLQLQLQQQQQHFQHAHPHVHPSFQSPFTHNVPVPRSHSAGGHGHPWNDEYPGAPHSAREPVMSHPYMSRSIPRPQTQTEPTFSHSDGSYGSPPQTAQSHPDLNSSRAPNFAHSDGSYGSPPQSAQSQPDLHPSSRSFADSDGSYGSPPQTQPRPDLHTSRGPVFTQPDPSYELEQHQQHVHPHQVFPPDDAGKWQFVGQSCGPIAEERRRLAQRQTTW
ncbi:hypothetical protein C8R43DRAFT_1241606 [Mycena crocata]|nr:hypothetical protein C8R43DRAFT_1241606 [Mycena crocata]